MNIQRMSTAGATQASQNARARMADVTATNTRGSEAPTSQAGPAKADEVATPGTKVDLEAVSKSADKRLEALLDSKQLSPRQQAALQDAKEHFQTLVQRLDQAYANGTESSNGKTMQESVDRLLEVLAARVNNITSGGLAPPDSQLDLKV